MPFFFKKVDSDPDFQKSTLTPVFTSAYLCPLLLPPRNRTVAGAETRAKEDRPVEKGHHRNRPLTGKSILTPCFLAYTASDPSSARVTAPQKQSLSNGRRSYGYRTAAAIPNTLGASFPKLLRTTTVTAQSSF